MPPRLSHAFAKLQLEFASRCVDLGLGTSADALNRLTNLQRRIGFGLPNDPPSDSRWLNLLQEVSVAPHTSAAADLVMEAATAAPPAIPEHVVHDWPTVGMFSIQIVDKVARTHFYAEHQGDVSPFHPLKLYERRAELREVLSIVRQQNPGLSWVAGGSWMYSASAYRELFPPSHLASGVVRTDRTTFQGMSHWGQFLNFRGELREDRADEFLTRVSVWDGTNPCGLFPVPTLDVASPIKIFDDYQAAKG